MINYIMNTIDNDDINFENIVEKIELMKILILELQSDLKKRLYHRERKNRDQRRDHENQNEVEQLPKQV